MASLRRVRSYARRGGRLTQGQERAIKELWPRYGLRETDAFDPLSVFGRRALLTLEIGFGDGANLIALAQQYPEQDFLGIDVYRPGMGALFARLACEAIDNVRIYASDVTDVLRRILPPAVLTRALIFFPDPWPKRRHHKRRLIQPVFLGQLARALHSGGGLHLATDDADYAACMQACLRADPSYVLQAVRVNAGSPFRIPTRFERKGRELGHAIYDIDALKITDPIPSGCKPLLGGQLLEYPLFDGE